jgi:hypothetical protein
MYLMNLENVVFVKNMEDSKEWQDLCADFEVEFKGGKKAKVEAKSDRYENGSVYLETECGANEGCFVKSKADVWVYCHFNQNVAYWMPMATVGPWFLENAHKYPKKPAVSKENGRTWTAWGRVIPIADIMAGCEKVKPLPEVYEGAIALFKQVFKK